MNRAEAVAIYKEIMNLCESMGSNTFKLVSSPSDKKASTNYEIRITMQEDVAIKQQVANIAKKHNLAMKEKKGEVIIYKPEKT